MITKENFEKLMAFTLAEVLITMIVIILMTLASIPVIKKSKEFREAAKDKNSWAALYETNSSGTEQLVVYENGTKHTYPNNQYFENSTTAKFTPPAGVSKFNVTVIGGGGGGGAGSNTSDDPRVYISDPDNTQVQVSTFTPAKTGVYQVVAIGGGGGGGGGANFMGLTCTGSAGYSAGAVLANVELEKGKVYKVIPGLGGYRGHGYTTGEAFVDTFRDIAITIAVAGTIVGAAMLTGGLSLAGAMAAVGLVTGTAAESILVGIGVAYLIPHDPTDGGGTGQASEFSGDGVSIVAGGGRGGTFRRRKMTWYGIPKCKYADDPHEGDKTVVSGSSIKNSSKVDAKRQQTQKGGYICKNGSCTLSGLSSAIEGGVNSSFTFGNGGDAGSKAHGGKPGNGGYIQIRELPAYGGGGGQAGAVSFYAYEYSPVKNATNADGSKKTYVPVYVGKGGKGGQPSATEKFKRGQDGKFSRFGDRIIADGGAGGDIRVTSADTTTYRADGENGAETAVSASVLKQAKLPSYQDILYGGFKFNTTKINGQGHGQNNTGSVTNAVPGSGGGGGGAQTNSSFATMTPGIGGNGASGAVIVTW